MISNGLSRFKDALTREFDLDAPRAYLAIELTPDFDKLRRICYETFYSALICPSRCGSVCSSLKHWKMFEPAVAPAISE